MQIKQTNLIVYWLNVTKCLKCNHIWLKMINYFKVKKEWWKLLFICPLCRQKYSTKKSIADEINKELNPIWLPKEDLIKEFIE